jgi:glucosamine--fructose-6-phosphate aminotransferase (isomerizing)
MEARKRGAKIISICNVRESSIDRKSDYTIYTDAGPEIGVASTKAFSTQLVALAAFALFLKQERASDPSHDLTHSIQALLKVPGAINQILGNEKIIQEVAKEFFTYRDFLYLGRGNNFPIALEGALKLKEISYIHAEGYPAGEMKHGPIALIDEDMPVVVIAPRDRYYPKTLSNLEEVRSREGIIISIGTGFDEALQKVSKAYIGIPEIDEMFYPMLTVIPLQLLAYYIADLRGTDIDQPRNLAKSVTVE